MRMPAHHLVCDRGRNVGKAEQPGLLAHARVIDHLEQQIPELVRQMRPILARYGIGDLVRLLDRVGSDRGEILLAVPWAAAPRITQPRHDVEQAQQFGVG